MNTAQTVLVIIDVLLIVWSLAAYCKTRYAPFLVAIVPAIISIVAFLS